MKEPITDLEYCQMPLYRNVVDSDGSNDGVALGVILYENLSGDFSKDVRIDIENLMTPVQPVERNYCIAAWSVTLVNTGDTTNIQGFEGFPPRYKLGSVGYRTVRTVTGFEYWNYLEQGFRVNTCIVSPSGYGPVPISVSTTPAFSNSRAIVAALTQSTVGLRTDNIVKLNKSAGFLFGTTRFQVAPNLPAQVYTASVNFYAAWGLAPTNLPPTYVTNI